MNELVVIQKSELQEIIKSTVIAAIAESQKEKAKEKMNIKEAARYLGISVPNLNRKKDQGIVIFSKIDGRVVFSKKDLDEYFKKCKSTATQTVTFKK
ncbi:MAG: helix-turn-helix domain-containing protein [Campylobacterales bacterium]|nr:helix-turn-helix domain-containing protein [Campylobacterales bacterium]